MFTLILTNTNPNQGINELVGKPYISILVGEYSFGKVTVGQRTIEEKCSAYISLGHRGRTEGEGVRHK